jgi:hypothetical protein
MLRDSWTLSLSPGINPNREKAQNSMTHRLIDTLLFIIIIIIFSATVFISFGLESNV